MTVRVPIRTIYTNGTPTGLGEFQTGDAVGYLNGGTGLTTIGTAGQVLTVNDSASGFTFATTTSYGDADARGAISVTDAGGDGSLAYNSSTGVLTYTGPSASEVRAHFSAGTGVAISNGSISTDDTAIVHDSLSGFVANEHIDHSGVTLTAGAGLTGGGDISASRTFAVGAGTGVTVNADAVAIGQDVATTAGVTFATITTTSDVTVGGDLTVNGTTTTVNTETINLADNIILINSNEAGTPSQNGGIEIERGTSANKTFIWDEANDKWTIGSETMVAGTFEGNVTGNVTGDVTGNASTATALETARTIGGVSFNGTANINLPGVNTSGNQNTSGNAATATAFATGRTIALTGDVTGTSGSFDGTANLSFSTSIAANAVGASELNVSGNGSTAQFLRSDGDGSFTWATPTNTTYSAGTALTLSSTTFSVTDNGIGATQLNVSGNGTSGQALLSDGDGTFSWGAAGASITNDNTTNTTQYLAMSRSTSGSLTASYVAGSKLTFNPSTGILNSVDFNATSDESLKTNIETIQDAASKVSQLRGVNFNWKDNDRYAMGVIAQEVEKVIPEVVNEEDGTKSVSYGAIVGLLIEAVKDLQNQVDELKK